MVVALFWCSCSFEVVSLWVVVVLMWCNCVVVVVVVVLIGVNSGEMAEQKP